MFRLRITAASVLVLMLPATGCIRSPQAKRNYYLARGKTQLEKKDYSRALLEFRNAVRATPNDAEPYYEAGVAAQDLGDLRAAVGSFKQAVALNPNHQKAQLALAILMAQTTQKGLLQDAEARLRGIAAEGRNEHDRVNALALTDLKLGKIDDAIQALKAELAKAPGDLSTSIMLAQVQESQHDIKSAEDLLIRACLASPQNAEPAVALGQFYARQNRIAEAESEFRKGVAIDSKSGIARLQLAVLEYELGRKSEAEADFKRLAYLSDKSYVSMYGRYLFTEGRTDEAVREFARIAGENAGDRILRTQLVLAYQSSGKTAKAEQLLNDVLRKNPKDVDALTQRGEMLLQAKKLEAALADLNGAEHLQPTSAEVHYTLGKVFLAKGELLSYRSQLTEALRLNPNLLPARLELAQILLSSDPTASLQILAEAPAPQQETQEWMIARNWAFWATNDLSGMRKGIDAGLGKGSSPDLFLQDGLWKLRNGKPAEARLAVERELQFVPGDVRGLRALQLCYSAQHAIPAGIIALKKYVASVPKAEPAQEYLATVLLANGDRDGARSAFQAAEVADPSQIGPELGLAKLDYKERKAADAQKRLTALLAKDRDNPTVRKWLAVMEEAQGDKSGAIKNLQQVADADPRDAQAANNLAYLLSEYSNDQDSALKYAQRAVELAPDKPAYSDTLGWVLYHKGLYPTAITYLEKAVAAQNLPVWKYHLAMAYAKAGDSSRGGQLGRGVRARRA